MSTRSTAGIGPLQAIGENTVVELGADEALDADARFGLPVASPSPKKQSKKKKKRPRESVAFRSEKKRKQQLETLLDELETQVQEKCDELIAEAERRAQELEMELKVQLLFLPEAVRQMPWKTFVEDFGGDLQKAIYNTVAKAKAPSGSLVATFEKGLEPTSCCLQLDSDRVLDLSRPEELSAESRGEATSKLKALQAKVAQLLSQINPSSR
eukprot:jgi/Phyca11/531664/estExt2_fgenesh1_pg.C_PHYCAscaffold_10329